MPMLRGEVRLDLTNISPADRRWILTLAKRLGAVVPGADGEETSGRKESLRSVIARLESEVQARAPFSFYFPSDDDLGEGMRERGIPARGIPVAREALIRRGGSYACERTPLTNEINISQQRTPSGRIAITVHNPAKVSADGLRAYAYCLGEAGARNTLAVLAEVSKTQGPNDDLISLT